MRNSYPFAAEYYALCLTPASWLQRKGDRVELQGFIPMQGSVNDYVPLNVFFSQNVTRVGKKKPM